MSDGWHNIEQQRDSNGNPTAVAKAIQAIIDNGCDCDERDGECGGECFPGLCEAAIHEQFDEIARLRASLAPRESSPELAEAETFARSQARSGYRNDKLICGELDRLRAEVARLSQSASAHPVDTVDVIQYVAGESSKALYSKLTDPDDSVCLRETPEDADEDAGEDERVYDVRTIITRHDGRAPAQDRATRAEVRTLGDAWDDGVEAACEWFDVGASAPRLDSLYKENPYRTAERAGKDGT